MPGMVYISLPIHVYLYHLHIVYVCLSPIYTYYISIYIYIVTVLIVRMVMYSTFEHLHVSEATVVLLEDH